MSIAQTHAQRSPHDLSHLVFSAGQIGRLQTLSVVPVLGGDSYEQNTVGSLKLSPLRRGLSLDSKIDVFSFYIPHRHIYGDEWNAFMEAGVNATPLTGAVQAFSQNVAHLSLNTAEAGSYANIPKWLWEGYDNIYNNYFKYPWTEDVHLDPQETDAPWQYFGRNVAHLKSEQTQPLPPERDGRSYNAGVDGDQASISLQDLNQAYGALHTQQERELFGQRFRDVVSNLGGKTPYDADNRPRLLARTSQWASGYDIDGTAEESLGQHTGRVAQAVDHKVNRFAVPEHGAVWTVAVVRFPYVHRSEKNPLHSSDLTTYQDLVGDPAIVANHPPVDTNTVDMFWMGSPNDLDTGKRAHSYWHRYMPNTVHWLYQDLQGFPFLENIQPNGSDGAPPYVYAGAYDEVFQTTQLAHWNMQARNNINVMRALPTTRDSIVTNN